MIIGGVRLLHEMKSLNDDLEYVSDKKMSDGDTKDVRWNCQMRVGACFAATWGGFIVALRKCARFARCQLRGGAGRTNNA